MQTGSLELVAAGLEAGAVALYLYGVRQLVRRRRRWPPARTASFVAGVVSVWVATGSGLAAYDDVNVTVHVVQHVLLMMVAPPLLALGRPITLLCQAACRATQVRVVHAARSRLVRVLFVPALAWVAYFGSMYAYFLDTGAYDYSIQHPLIHAASHFIFFAIGYLYWQPLVASDYSPRPLSYPTRLLASAVGMPVELFLGLTFLLRTRTIDPVSTVADTHTAGEAFWILAMLTSSIWIGVIALQWLRRIDDETPRQDRRAERLAAESRAAAARLGIGGLADGWTVPSWRLGQLQAGHTGSGRGVHLPGIVARLKSGDKASPGG